MKFKTLLKKASKARMDYFHKTHYLHYYETFAVNDRVILLQSQHGSNLNGNIFYLAKEINNNSDYQDFKTYVVYAKGKKEVFQKMLKHYKLNNLELVRLQSKKYYQLCAEAKYLINDTSFYPFFIKKDEQVVLNTWHGTPLKCLGKKDNGGYHSMGNIQRNFVFSDYLLYPNEYMKEHMIEDYMLENLSKAKCLMAGYPRNEAFFCCQENRERISRDLMSEGINLEGKRIYAYMPTWRGTLANKSQIEQTYCIMHYLFEMDKRFTDEEILFVNLHPFVQDAVDYSYFKHILPFPKTYETYEFLSIADVLITDYSSVFYDFANTGHKIVLFAYDKEDYFEDRGVYVPLESLPFPIVSNPRDLIRELREEKQYDDKVFMKTYCPYDEKNISKKILDQVILSKDSKLKEIPIQGNGKDNVLIYAGNLAKNGITSSLISLLESIDLSKRNYFVTFSTAKVKKNKETILQLPEGVQYIPMSGILNANIYEKIAMMLYRMDKFSSDKMQKMLDRLYKYDIRRYYHTVKFSNVIQFNGYEYKRILEFARFDANRIIYVHNNMEEEIRLKGNQHAKTLEYAYNHYDKVAIVTSDMEEPTMRYCHDKNRLVVVNNTIDYEAIRKNGFAPVSFDESTKCKYSLEEVCEILEKPNRKFITIGRFSPEKGHCRLIDAFNELYKEDPSLYLFIIGGYGKEYSSTLEYAENSPAAEHIILIKSMSNPQPILKKCDYFVLPSFHEGLGLVLMEADIQGVPVMATDILGPRGFLKEHNGKLVSNDTEGIVQGMKDCLAGKVKVMNVDYAAYNQHVVDQFESILV